jgi:N-acetylglucosaminyl-diphospho-decaprenol L-rhamnosyltransferase
VRVIVRKQNGGFAAAALDGAQAADYRLMLLMHPDVVVRPGALTALAAAMQHDTVLAATSRVLEGGAEDRPVSRRTLAVEDGRLVSQDPRGALPADEDGPVPVPFAASCATLVRREEFLASGGYDRLFAPLGFEDVDAGLTAWRRGRRVIEVPAAVVERHAGGTVSGHAPEALLRAALERNRLLVHWKHLSSKREAHDHLVALWRDALDAGLCGRREDLVHLALALGELDAVAAARPGMADAKLGLEDVLAAAR